MGMAMSLFLKVSKMRSLFLVVAELTKGKSKLKVFSLRRFKYETRRNLLCGEKQLCKYSG